MRMREREQGERARQIDGGPAAPACGPVSAPQTRRACVRFPHKAYITSACDICQASPEHPRAMLQSPSVPSSPSAAVAVKDKHVAHDHPAPQTPQRVVPHSVLDASFTSASSPGLDTSVSSASSTPAFGTPSARAAIYAGASGPSPLMPSPPLTPTTPATNAVQKKLEFVSDDDGDNMSDIEDLSQCQQCGRDMPAKGFLACDIKGRNCCKYPVCDECTDNKYFSLNACDGCGQTVCTACRTGLPIAEDWLCHPCGKARAKSAGCAVSDTSDDASDE